MDFVKIILLFSLAWLLFPVACLFIAVIFTHKPETGIKMFFLSNICVAISLIIQANLGFAMFASTGVFFPWPIFWVDHKCRLNHSNIGYAYKVSCMNKSAKKKLKFPLKMALNQIQNCLKRKKKN